MLMSPPTPGCGVPCCVETAFERRVEEGLHRLHAVLQRGPGELTSPSFWISGWSSSGPTSKVMKLPRSRGPASCSLARIGRVHQPQVDVLRGARPLKAKLEHEAALDRGGVANHAHAARGNRSNTGSWRPSPL